MGFLNACTWNDELGHNQYCSVIGVKPVAFPGAGGYLRRITNKLGNTGDPAFPVGVDELAQFRIDTRLAGKSPLFYFGKGQSRVTMVLLGANNVAGMVSGNSVIFPNAWNNADLRLTIAGHRLQKEIFLKAGHPSQFQFRIDSHAGLDVGTLSTPDFRILDPVLTDPKSPGFGTPLKWFVSTSGGKAILTVTLPPGDHAGKILDPTFILQPDASAGKDNFTNKDFPNTSQGSENFLRMRSNYDISLLKFDLSTLPSSGNVIASHVYTWAVNTIAPTSTITVRRILAANATWSELSTWNYRVPSTEAWAGAVGCTLSGTDFSATVMGSWVMTNGDLLGTAYSASLNLAEFALLWATNNGFVFVVTAGGGNTVWVCSSDHATPAYRPMLTVDYSLPTAGRKMFQSAFTGAFG